MSKPTLSTYGGRTLEIGYAGQLSDQTENVIESHTNAGTDAIDFGVAVAVAGDRQCKKVSADADRIAGISVRQPSMPALTSDNVVAFAAGYDVPVLRWGKCFAVAAEAVREGDQVLSLTASGGALGGTNGGVAGTGRVVVPGAIWRTTTASGAVGEIFVNGGEAAVLTS